MRKISIVTPCYNEEENVAELCEAVRGILCKMDSYSYEHIFIDNCSSDKTVEILKRIANADKNVKIIINAKNFGHLRSPYHALLQASGDAVVLLAADFQDPPEMMVQFIRKWEEGYRVVIGIKTESKENRGMFAMRRLYYSLMKRFSETEHIENFTGFGLYDRSFIEVLRSISDPYPYLRGLVAELGFHRYDIRYTQPRRRHGSTKNDFFTLFDTALLGMVNHTKAPLRLATLLGFFIGIASLLISLFYLVYKLIYWERFNLGSAPIIIGFFFFSSVQLFFTGLIGEYVGAIFTQVRNRPRAIEKERINF